MTPTSFEFILTMPGDARLLDAVRELAAHAAGYARLAPEAGQGLAGHVACAAEAAIAATREPDAPIEFRFFAADDAIRVFISCDAAPSATPPASISSDGITIDWHRDGARQTCCILQRVRA